MQQVKKLVGELRDMLGEKKGDKLTITLTDPIRKKIKDEPEFRAKLKSIKPQGKYKTKAAAKRAFLAGLIRKLDKQENIDDVDFSELGLDEAETAVFDLLD